MLSRLSEIWSDVRFRVRSILRRRAVEQELDDELRFHIEREAERYVAQGVTGTEALRRARLEFGGVDRIKEDARDVRGTRILEQVVNDVRYAWRGLRTRPGFTAVAVTTLALGVGANAAMFGVLDRLLFRSPAFLIDAPLVHRVYLHRTIDGQPITEGRTEYATYADLARWSTAFSQTAAFAYRDEAVGTGEDVEERLVGVVSSSFFEFFSARPVIGRYFVREEDVAPSGAPVVVLAHAYWQSRYAGRHDVLGATLRIGREHYRIIGVAPPHFHGVSDLRAPVAFVPVTTYAATRDTTYASRYNWTWLDVLVRRKRAVTHESATADLTNAYRRSWQQLPANPGFEAVQARASLAPVQLARGPLAGPESRVVKWVSGVALIVLIIACANVANLLLLRALRRRGELVLRRALGGSRARVAQQLLTETLVLAVLGGIGGVLAAHWGGSVLRRLFLDASTATDVFGDARTLVFAAVVTLGTAIVAGVAPAAHAGRIDLADTLKAGMHDASYRRSRTRSALLVAQSALAVILLVGASLFVRSLQQLRAIRLGYDVEPVIHVRTTFRDYAPDAGQSAQLTDRLLEEARAIPGVTHATPNTYVPFLGGWRPALTVPGVDSVGRFGRFSAQAGSPSYFATVGTRVLRGRGIEPTDGPNAPRVAVVSAAMAEVLWPGRDALGQCLRVGRGEPPCTTVVGIAEDVRMRSLTAPPEFQYYLSYAQYQELNPGDPPELFVRVGGRAADFTETVRRRLQRIMPGSSYVVATPLQQFVEPTVRSWQFGATLFLAFGMLALTLAAIGLYAVIAFGVTQRTHELGVRIALGADRADVLGLVVGEGLRHTLAGVLIGSAVALVASQRLTPLLFDVSPRDPAVYALVTLTLVAVGIAASALPARRAARVDPNLALRAE